MFRHVSIDVKYHTLSFFQPEDMARFAQVDHSSYDLVKSKRAQFIWQQKYAARYPEQYKGSLCYQDVDWQLEFKKQYKKDKLYQKKISQYQLNQAGLRQKYNRVDREGWTILHWAIHCNQPVSTVDALLSAGCGVDYAWLSATPLYLAAYHGNQRLVRCLLSAGANVNVHSVGGSVTPIFGAIHSGNVNILNLFISIGADINHLTSHEITPLADAAYHGNVPMIKSLLSAGARLDNYCAIYKRMSGYRFKSRYRAIVISNIVSALNITFPQFLESYLSKVSVDECAIKFKKIAKMAGVKSVTSMSEIIQYAVKMKHSTSSVAMTLESLIKANVGLLHEYERASPTIRF